jgi:acid stress-induced BolA-like protein IbaG/YrbA
VSSAFAGLARVRRQQAVYACIQQVIADGSLHAVTMRVLTPDEARAG